MSFTRCRHRVTGGEADLATEALGHWAILGWEPVKDAPAPRGRKTEKSDETTEKE